jgi:Family of unknown function (DUF6263)
MNESLSMKKFFLFVVFISILGCDKGNVKPKTYNEVSNKNLQLTDISASEKDNTYKLSYNLVKGKEYKFKITSLSHEEENIKSGDSSVTSHADQNATYILSLKLNNIDEDSVYNINCKISSIAIDMNVNGTKESYQSGITPDSIVKNKYAQYDAILNNDFDVRVNKIGDVSEISRIDKMTDKFLKEKGYADSVNQNEKDQLRMRMSEGIIRPIVTQIFREFPSKPIRIDSSWSVKQPKGEILIFQSENTLEYKLKGIKTNGNNKFAQITAGLTATFEGKNTVTNNGITYNFKKPKAEGSGDILFNLTDGMLQNSKTTSKLEISYSANLPTGKNKKGERTSITTVTNGVERI